jgi:hypothetical protein
VPPDWAFLGLLTFMSIVPQNRSFYRIGGLTCVPDAPVGFWRFGGHSLCDQRIGGVAALAVTPLAADAWLWDFSGCCAHARLMAFAAGSEAHFRLSAGDCRSPWLALLAGMRQARPGPAYKETAWVYDGQPCTRLRSRAPSQGHHL